MSNKEQKLTVLQDLEVKVKEFMVELDSLEDNEDFRDITQSFKVYAYKLTLKRLFLLINILKKIEERLEIEVEAIEDVNELMTVYKSLVKGMDLINSQLRFFFPSKLSEEVKQDEQIISEIISEDGNVNTKKLLVFKIKDLLSIITRIRKDMDLFDSGSVDYWKAQNSYLELTAKLIDYVKALEKLEEQENNQEVELTIEDILNAYKEIEELEEKEIEKIEENWNKQRQQIKEN
jgi:hypothetical protein